MGCALYKSYIATALLAVKVWIKVWKAGSLDFATTLKHNAIQGVEGGPCSPSILENYFWQRAAVCIIQQLVWGKKIHGYLLRVATSRSYFVFPSKKEIALRS